MEKEFKTLSEKIHSMNKEEFDYIRTKDIKEFIKRLKDKLGKKAVGSSYAEEWINKLAGEKLI